VFDSRLERSPRTVTPKVSTGASKSLYQARPRAVAFSKNRDCRAASLTRQPSARGSIASPDAQMCPKIQTSRKCARVVTFREMTSCEVERVGYRWPITCGDPAHRWRSCFWGMVPGATAKGPRVGRRKGASAGTLSFMLCFDFYLRPPDSGERQYKSSTNKG